MLQRLDALRDPPRGFPLASSFTRRVALASAAKLALGGVLGLTVAGQLADRAVAQATPAALALAAYPEVKITLSTQGVRLAPTTVPAGFVLLTLVNQLPASSGQTASVGLVGPPAGMSFAAFVAQVKAQAKPASGLPPIAYQATIPGGPGNIDPGQTGQAIVSVPAGRWLVAGGSQGQPPTLTATPGTPGATRAPKAAVTITEVDFAFGGFDVPIAAGKQIWQVEHQGTQPHMLVLLQLPAGATVAQLLQIVSLPNNATPSPGMLNPAQFQDRGGVFLQSKGTTVWPVLELPAGHYGALCFVGDPAKGGEPHAMEGMTSVFDVK